MLTVVPAPRDGGAGKGAAPGVPESGELDDAARDSGVGEPSRYRLPPERALPESSKSSSTRREYSSCESGRDIVYGHFEHEHDVQNKKTSKRKILTVPLISRAARRDPEATTMGGGQSRR